MTTPNYEEVLTLVKQLTFEEQIMLLEDLTAMVHRQRAEEPEHNIMEFKGVGKETWVGIDVEAYINEERDSWDR